MIGGLIALCIIVFIFSILGILDILSISVTGITLEDNLVIKKNIVLRAVTRIAREGMPSRRLGIRMAKIMITILTRSIG
jgi:hypothetical protein